MLSGRCLIPSGPSDFLLSKPLNAVIILSFVIQSLYLLFKSCFLLHLGILYVFFIIFRIDFRWRQVLLDYKLFDLSFFFQPKRGRSWFTWRQTQTRRPSTGWTPSPTNHSAASSTQEEFSGSVWTTNKFPAHDFWTSSTNEYCCARLNSIDWDSSDVTAAILSF